MPRQEQLEAVNLFFCYAHEDEGLQSELSGHLSSLRRQGLIKDWNHFDIKAGQDRRKEVATFLKNAHIILLLVSPDFMKSDYYHGFEMKRAMERHNKGEAKVIPILLRSVDIIGAPFASLQMLPRGERAVKSWGDRDEAYTNIVLEIRKVIYDILSKRDPVDELMDELEEDNKSPILADVYIKSAISKDDLNLSHSRQSLYDTNIINKNQKQEIKEDQWVDLKWFILISAILSLVLLPLVFLYHSQPIIVFDTLLVLTSLLLGLVQSFHLNHWYWFTGMLISGPLAGIMYSWFNPKTKQLHSRPPRQLSLIILMLGFTWLFIFSVIFPSSGNIQNLYIGICVDLLVTGSLLALIRAIRMGHLKGPGDDSTDPTSAAIMLLLFPIVALIYIMFYSKEES